MSHEIAVIGGGTGNATILRGLREYDVNLSAIVNMSDDGGSSGVLRQSHDVLPPGDIRQCQVALSTNPLMAEALNTRGQDGHPPGNILIADIARDTGSFETAVSITSRLLGVRGKVLPATLDKHDLVMQDGDERVIGEHLIGHREFSTASPSLWLEPPAKMTDSVEEVLHSSDLIVIAPGNLYGSILPALAVDGVAQAIRSSRSPVAMVGNLVNKPGQTQGWHAVDYLHAIQDYIGQDEVDYLVYNTDLPDPDFLARHNEAHGEAVRTHSERFHEVTAQAIGGALLSRSLQVVQNDRLAKNKRNTIKHSQSAVAKQIMSLLKQPVPAQAFAA